MRQSRAGAVLAVSVAAAAVLTACEQPPDPNAGPRWYGAAVTSPHTRSATLLGLSQGPYVVKCWGTHDNLTVDVAAPDGWGAVFRSPEKEWTLRKSRTSEAVRLTGSEDGVSYLKIDPERYVVDSEVYASPPKSWDIGDDLVHINMYIDCSPPKDREQIAPSTSRPTLPPPSTPAPEKGQGTP